MSKGHMALTGFNNHKLGVMLTENIKGVNIFQEIFSPVLIVCSQDPGIVG